MVSATTFEIPSQQYPTIQDGLDAAASGDTVLVQPGLYSVVDLDFQGKELLLRGVDPEDSLQIAATILDGGGNGRVLYFHSGENSDAEVLGLTITGGDPAVAITSHSAASFTQCVLRDNERNASQATSSAGIAVSGGGYLRVEDCTFRRNSVFGSYADGGAIQFLDASGDLLGSRFVDNHSDRTGGAVTVWWPSTVNFRDNLFLDNVAPSSGGAVYHSGYGIFSNCEFTGNGGSGVYGGAIHLDRSHTVENCLFQSNQGSRGGALYVESWGNVTILDTRMEANNASDGGGATFSDAGAQLRFTRATLESNQAANSGGAVMALIATTSLTDCALVANDCGGSGGAAYFDGGESVSLTRCSIFDNSAGVAGGGMYCSGTHFSMINTLVCGNTAENKAGGLLCNSAQFPASTLIDHCTFSSNLSSEGSDALRHGNQQLTLSNSILWSFAPQPLFLGESCQATITFCDIKGGWTGSGNLNAEPHFISAQGFDYVLAPVSPCIDSATGGDDGLIWCDIHPGYCNHNTQAPDMGAYGGPEAAGWLE
jgi:hypothetical protein